MTKKKDTNKTAANEPVMPTKERFNQNGGLKIEDVGLPATTRYRANWECPLDAYKDMNLITAPEHRAGMRFREAYYKAVLSRRAAYERLNRYPTTTGLTMSERLVRDAQQTVPSHNIGVVIDICGYDRPARDNVMLEKLRKGLGHLAIRWHSAAIETCEHKKK